MPSSNSDGGGRVLMFGPSNPDEEDLISEAMITEYRSLFGSRITALSCSENVGSGHDQSGRGIRQRQRERR